MEVLRDKYTGADRVFMSTSEDSPPELLSDARIKGMGSVRHGAGWSNFGYECAIDATTGDVVYFSFHAIAGE